MREGTQGMGSPLAELTARLNEPLPKDEISKRQGPGGARLDYLTGSRVIRTLNEVFGPLGWSRSVDKLEREVELVDRHDKKTGKTVDGFTCVATALVTVRIHPLPTGVPIASHTDVGHGVTQGVMPDRGSAIEFAEKAACKDALKRAVHVLGPRFGLALYMSKVERLDEGVVTEESRQPAVSAPSTAERDVKPVNDSEPEPEVVAPIVAAARWLLAGEIDDTVLEALRAGDHPGRTSELLEGALPPDPAPEEVLDYGDQAGVRSSELEDVARWPAGQPVTGEVLNELHGAALEAVGDHETERLWRELGVELKRGARVTGYQARLMVAAIAVKEK